MITRATIYNTRIDRQKRAEREAAWSVYVTNRAKSYLASDPKEANEARDAADLAAVTFKAEVEFWVKGLFEELEATRDELAKTGHDRYVAASFLESLGAEFDEESRRWSMPEGAAPCRACADRRRFNAPDRNDPLKEQRDRQLATERMERDRLRGIARDSQERLRELVAIAEMLKENTPGHDLFVEILLAKDCDVELTAALSTQPTSGGGE
jgi:hypothetical protein